MLQWGPASSRGARSHPDVSRLAGRGARSAEQVQTDLAERGSRLECRVVGLGSRRPVALTSADRLHVHERARAGRGDRRATPRNAQAVGWRIWQPGEVTIGIAGMRTSWRGPAKDADASVGQCVGKGRWHAQATARQMSIADLMCRALLVPWKTFRNRVTGEFKELCCKCPKFRSQSAQLVRRRRPNTPEVS